MEIEFRCDEHGSIPASAVVTYPPNNYVVVCFGCDSMLRCRITETFELQRIAPDAAPTINALGNGGDKLPESEEPYDNSYP